MLLLTNDLVHLLQATEQAHMYIHSLTESTSVSHTQQDVEQVINTHLYTIFTVQNTINISQNSITDHLYI
jgi:uncharacterized protein (DUF302 family)